MEHTTCGPSRPRATYDTLPHTPATPKDIEVVISLAWIHVHTQRVKRVTGMPTPMCRVTSST
jgi:hypothetical protein